jgi:hypothetical protein
LDLNVDNLEAQVTGTGDILIDELDGFTVDAMSTNNGSITINTLGDLTVDGTIDAGNSTVQLNLAALNKTLTLAAGAIVRAAGAMQFIADRMDFDSASSIITDTINHEVFLQPYTAGRLIKLGEADALDALGLTADELNTISARSIIIGELSQLSGNITIAGISPLAIANSSILCLVTGGSVTQSTALIVPKLVIVAQGNVILDNTGNDADELAASIGSGSSFKFVDSDDLAISAIGSVDLGDTVYGITTDDAAIMIITSGDLTANDCANPDTTVADIDAGDSTIELNTGTGTLTLNSGSSVKGLGGITYIADDMNLNGTSVTSATDTSVYFYLKPFTVGWAIDLGTNTLGKLGLTDAEIDRITARKIIIGSADAGQISITAAITKSGDPVAIHLITGEGVDDNSGTGSIGRPSSGTHNLYLGIEAVGPVSLTNNFNRITNLAAKITGEGNGFTYVDRDSLVITGVDGIKGVSTNNGPISITAGKSASGDLTVNDISSYNNEIDAGDSTVLLSVNRLNDTLTLNSGSNVIGRGGVTYICDKIDLKSSSKTDAGSNTASIRQYTNNRPVKLGPTTNADGSLSISDAELDTIYAGELRIGDSNSGNITLSNQISPAHSGSLYLITGAAIVDNHDGIDAVVPSIDLTAATGINIDTRSTSITAATTSGDIDIDNTNSSPVTANTTATGGNILFSQTGGASLTAQASASGNVGIDVTGGDLIIDKITAGLANSVTLDATGAILAGTPPTGPPLVTALTLDMAAGTGIGTATDPITAQISELYAEATGTGSIYLELDELVSGNGVNLNTVTTNDGDIFITANSGDLYLGTITGDNVNITADNGDIIDDGTEDTWVTANNASFSAVQGNIGATSADADIDVDAATISANALLDIGIEAQSGTFFDGVTSDNGAVVLLSNGATYLRDITAADDVVITNTSGDLVFRGKVESIDSGVTVTSQQGSIATEVVGPHIAAKTDSYINVPNGTITLNTTPLDVSVSDGFLVLDIGEKIGLDSGKLTSPNLIPDEVFFIPSSYPSPLYPKGNVWLNGARIWPSASSFANSQALLQLLSKASLPDAQEFLRFLINSLDPRGLLFYHPLSPFDAAAFAALQFGAESYILSGNTLNLNGHDGLLPIFDQIKKKRKITI